jgi:AcrR family transcriptional regulator
MPKISDEKLAARRRQILEAAATCFARDGFHRTSMQDIVTECGISAGLVYRYFTGKDDMIAAIVAEWHDERRAWLAPGDREPAAAAYLELLRSLKDPAKTPDLRLSVQVWAEALRSPRILDVVRAGVDGPRAQIAEMLGPDSDGLARVLIALYQGLLLQTVYDDTVDNDAFVRVVEGVLARSR